MHFQRCHPFLSAEYLFIGDKNVFTWSGCSTKSTKIVSMFYKEERICYTMTKAGEKRYMVSLNGFDLKLGMK